MDIFLKRQKGQALILVVAAIIGLIGIVALAIDGGNAFSDRRHAQNAADTAALAAALAKTHTQDWSRAGYDRAASNGYTNDGVRSTVTVNNPPSSDDCRTTDPASPYVGNDEYIQVIIHSNLDTFFAPVIGVDQVHNCVEAIARAKPPTTQPIAYGNAMVSLDPHDCKAFWFHGTSSATVSGGGVFVNSDCATGSFQAFDQNGSSLLTAPNICVVGGATYNVGDVNPIPTTGCTPLPYPPEYIWPDPSCDSDAVQTGNTISAGNVPGSWITGDMTLEPGIYCIDGDVKLSGNGTINGQNVLLYMKNGLFHVNGTVTVHLSALNNGPYAGLLIYLPLTNHNYVELNGTSLSDYTGTVLAPASTIIVNGTGDAYGYHSQFVGYTTELGGGAYANIFYNDSENYDITVPASIEITR